MTLSFFVPGIPAPQGSKRAFIIHGKDGKLHAPLVESSKAVKPWRAVIALAARQAKEQAAHAGWFNKEPLALTLVFLVPRPASLPRRVTRPVSSRGDLDKLVRACGDALKAVLYGDDGQIVELHASKAFAGAPGVTISVWALVDPAPTNGQRSEQAALLPLGGGII